MDVPQPPTNQPPSGNATAEASQDKPSLADAYDDGMGGVAEFVLTTILLFVTVPLLRWLRDAGSPLYVADLGSALGIVAAVTGCVLVGLILSPLGHRSGAHMNPGVTVALWLTDTFPGRSVLAYVVAQLGGSVVGTGIARLVWGPVVSGLDIGYGAIRPAGGWDGTEVFLAEVGSFIVLTLVVGIFLTHPSVARGLPYAVGLSVALLIVFLGPSSGGCDNPARYFGPAVMGVVVSSSGSICLHRSSGAVLGASVHHLLVRRFHTREALTYKLSGVQQRLTAEDTPT